MGMLLKERSREQKNSDSPVSKWESQFRCWGQCESKNMGIPIDRLEKERELL